MMKLKEILAISGQPGLYQYVAQAKRGVIVESLADGHRFNAPESAKVSALSEIALFTASDDVPLSEVFTRLDARTGHTAALGHKEAPERVRAYFAEILPDYDRDRVHLSDMKKVLSWYNMLLAAGMTDFTVEKEEPGDDPAAAAADTSRASDASGAAPCEAAPAEAPQPAPVP